MKRFGYDFEQELINLEIEIQQLKSKEDLSPDEVKKLDELEKTYSEQFKKTYSNLTPWKKVLLARHPYRPTAVYFINKLFKDFKEIKADRRIADDPAVICGFAFFGSKKVAVSAIEKGSDAREKQKRRFGMPLPEGYYKFIRLLELAEKLRCPVITLIDTPGAYPGIEAEERGQAIAIARAIERMVEVKVPTIAVVIGEGGSGGALAMAAADRIYVFENAYFSVISPEGCASILFESEKEAEKAASLLKLTAEDLLSLGLIHGIVPEPEGSSYRAPEKAAENLKKVIETALSELEGFSPEELVQQRKNFFLQIKY